MVTVIEIRSFYSPNFNYLSFTFLLTMARSWQPKVWTLAQIASLQKGNRIYLDQAFQSKARWGTKQKQAFINSCLRGFATGAITLGHIPSLKNYVLLNHGEDHEDYIFYSALEKLGYEWITIDGNNRDNTVKEFLDSVFPLTEGKYELDNGNIITATRSSKNYKDLDTENKAFVDNIPLNIHIIKEGTRRDLAFRFRNINEGISLNDQEKRNAISSKFGDSVRALVEECEAGFVKIFTPNNMNRRFPDELVVTISNLVAQGLVNVNRETRDLAYGDFTPEMKTFAKTKKIVKQITDITEKFGRSGLDIDGKFKGTIIDFALLLKYLNQNNIRIDDNQKFYNFFAESQGERLQSDDVVWNNKKETDPRTYSGVLKNLQTQFLKIREEECVKSLESIPDGILTYLDGYRNYNPKIRFFLWKRQDGKCALTKEKIAAIDVCNGNLTHVDHYLPYTHGGETTLENARLVLKSANLSKGSSLPDEVDTSMSVD